jgi:hypothetical protein
VRGEVVINDRIESRRAGSQIVIRVPDTLAAQLPQSEAYVFQIEWVH